MSTTQARTTIENFTSDEIGVREARHETIFLGISGRCDIMLGHEYSKPEEIAEEIRALRKLAETAEDVARQLEARQAAADLDRAIAADLDEQTAPTRPGDLDDADGER
jgi:hypothetical protein